MIISSMFLHSSIQLFFFDFWTTTGSAQGSFLVGLSGPYAVLGTNQGSPHARSLQVHH